MNSIRFFTKSDCKLCDAAMYVIRRVRRDTPFDLEVVNIAADGNERWLDAYRNDIPVVHLNDREIFRHRVEERALRRILGDEVEG